MKSQCCISWTYCHPVPYLAHVATVATRSPRATSVTTLYRSTIGKKIVMAVSGIILLLFVIVHMLGNLKIFFGQTDFDHYAHWLRTIGEPALHYSWYLWVQRVVLTLALVAHIWAAATLSAQDLKARPVGYVGRRRGGYATSTMRWGGVILLAFIVYHLLDLTTGTLNPGNSNDGPYQRVLADFNIWYITLAYVIAMLALCLHIWHGLWSAANTLGVNTATTTVYRTLASVVAVAVTVGFLIVPFGVIVGWVD
jgi:succinate dehydrogenase / fumarate reductase cytochrome b subunit